MIAQQRTHRFWLETAIIFAAWAVFGLLLANQSYIQSALGGRQMPWIVALRPGLLEASLWAFTTVAIFWLAGGRRRDDLWPDPAEPWPVRRDRRSQRQDA